MAGLAIGLLTLSVLRLKSNTGTRITSHGGAALCYSSAQGQRAAILVHVCVSACRCVTVSVFMLYVILRQSPEPCERRHSSLSSEALQTPTHPELCCHKQNLGQLRSWIFFLLVRLFLMLTHSFSVTPSSPSSCFLSSSSYFTGAGIRMDHLWASRPHPSPSLTHYNQLGHRPRRRKVQESKEIILL